ncbi:MAG: NUDIX hydrolase [Aeromicrobium erythreum]
MTPHPDLPGRLGGPEVADADQEWPVADSTTHYDSPYVALAVDTIVAPDGTEHGRAVVRPNGAVGVLALDADDRVLLVQQYRHPVRSRLVELPAGTLDVAGESGLAAAQRELAEEADVEAEEWTELLRLAATPGYSTERWTVFRASGLRPVPEDQREERQAEEADMQQWWVPFETVVSSVLAGRVADAMTVAAVLAERARRSR